MQYRFKYKMKKMPWKSVIIVLCMITILSDIEVQALTATSNSTTTSQFKDINECSYTCNWTNSNCTNLNGSYICSCVKGFQLDAMNASCIDINECQLKSTVCPSFSACENNVGSYTCKCLPGYSHIGPLNTQTVCKNLLTKHTREVLTVVDYLVVKNAQRGCRSLHKKCIPKN